MTEILVREEGQVMKLKDIAAYQDHSVVSREIIGKPSGTMTVLCL